MVEITTVQYAGAQRDTVNVTYTDNAQLIGVPVDEGNRHYGGEDGVMAWVAAGNSIAEPAPETGPE